MEGQGQRSFGIFSFFVWFWIPVELRWKLWGDGSVPHDDPTFLNNNCFRKIVQKPKEIKFIISDNLLCIISFGGLYGVLPILETLKKKLCEDDENKIRKTDWVFSFKMKN